MPSRTGPLHRLKTNLATRAKTAEGRALVERLERAGVVCGTSRDLGALLWSCRPGGDPAGATIVRALSELVPENELAGVCLLVAYAPALAHMARWLAARGCSRDDAEATAIAALFGAASQPGAHEACTLYRAAWSAVRLAGRAQSRSAAAEFLVGDVDVEPATVRGDGGAESAGLILHDALRARAIRPDQAALLRRLYVDDEPAWMVARSSGRSPRAISMARRRAEHALAAFLSETDRV